MFRQKRKYCKDIIMRKFKRMFSDSLQNFINKKLAELESKNYLRKLSYHFLKSKNIFNYNKQLFQITLGEYFSNDVNLMYQDKDYNRKLIKRLINEDKEKKNYKILFNKTILECLEHFRGTKKIDGLEGLEIEYSKMIKKLEKKEKDEKYILKFINIIYTFENI